MFSIGDTVCYPLHGVGKIESIEDRAVLDKTATYYVISLMNTRMTALLPVDAAESVGLRSIIDASLCDELYEYISTAPADIGSSNWNQRYRDNMEKLRKGDPHSVIDVILCLSKRGKMRNLSSGERKMLSNAKAILSAEISAASGKNINEIESVLYKDIIV